MGDNIENRKEKKEYIEVKLTIRTTKTITIITTTAERQNEKCSASICREVDCVD